MPAILQRSAAESCIRLSDIIDIASVAELRNRLLEVLTRDSVLRLDLTSATHIDVSVLQLLWAATREAESLGARVEIEASDAVAAIAREAGFGCILGETSRR